MMKKILRVVWNLACCLLLVCVCNACAELPATETEKTYTITFIQEGQTNVIRTVREGERLGNIPQPAEVPGYNVSWSITEFPPITSDLTVTIMKEPKTFTIYYSLGVLEGYGKVSTFETQKDVLYNSNFTLAVPMCEGYKFLGWVLEGTEGYYSGGTYTYLTDITVTAAWELVDEDLGWSTLH